MMAESLDVTELLRRANSTTKLREECNLGKSFESYSLVEAVSMTLSDHQKNTIFEMYSQNMKALYEAIPSWGWSDNEKSKDLFRSTSKFLLLVNPDNNDDVKAFTMFRFEWDDEDEPEHPVLFCYELQIASSEQRKGLGKALMTALLKISKQLGLWKTMLTCFKSNTSAMDFYHKVGFSTDVNSPSSCGYFDEPYEILSDKPKLR